MDYSAVWISLKTAFVSMFFTFFLGLFAAKWVVSLRNNKLKSILDAIFTLPLVLPPTVAGFFLLYIFGVNRPVGKFFMEVFQTKIVFTWQATVIAAVVISFPLMYRSARGSFEQIDQNYIYAARTLGMKESKIFWTITIPLALPGVASGAILAFARGLGEFGATAMIAGNIAGKTRTLPLAVYSAVSGGHMEEAFGYVAILVGISFLVVIGMSAFSTKVSRYQ